MLVISVKCSEKKRLHLFQGQDLLHRANFLRCWIGEPGASTTGGAAQFFFRIQVAYEHLEQAMAPFAGENAVVATALRDGSVAQ
jgi:hypothetical protein